VALFGLLALPPQASRCAFDDTWCPQVLQIRFDFREAA
jgi:hypothetical protein